MRRVALVLVALVPGLVWAQGVALNITFAQGAETQTVGPDDCDIDIPVSWTLNSGVIACDDLQFWLATGNCGTEPGSNPIVFETSIFPTDISGSFVLPAVDLPVDAGADGGTGCGAIGIEQTFKLCGGVRYNLSSFCGSGDATATDNQPPTIRYDSKPPAAPEITRVEPLDSALSVSVTATDQDTTALIVVVTDPSGIEVAREERQTPGGSITIRVRGLDNGTTYTVTAVARDSAGTLSPESAPSLGTPVLTCGFLCHYVSAGGSETGCSSAGGALLASAGVLAGIWLARARRRRSR
jgi:hypothetical protein